MVKENKNELLSGDLYKELQEIISLDRGEGEMEVIVSVTNGCGTFFTITCC